MESNAEIFLSSCQSWLSKPQEGRTGHSHLQFQIKKQIPPEYTRTKKLQKAAQDCFAASHQMTFTSSKITIKS